MDENRVGFLMEILDSPQVASLSALDAPVEGILVGDLAES